MFGGSRLPISRASRVYVCLLCLHRLPELRPLTSRLYSVGTANTQSTSAGKIDDFIPAVALHGGSRPENGVAAAQEQLGNGAFSGEPGKQKKKKSGRTERPSQVKGEGDAKSSDGGEIGPQKESGDASLKNIKAKHRPKARRKRAKVAKEKTRKSKSSALVRRVHSKKKEPEKPREVISFDEVEGASQDDTIVRGTEQAEKLQLMPILQENPKVPKLSYGLERVLFNPGVYHLQDPRTRVYNFDPYLSSIMPVSEFDFAALNEYITSSRDEWLRGLAKENGKKYIASSSSMTSVLSQFHFLLSAWRPINTNMLSQGFTESLRSFTRITRAPSAVFLKYKDGVYAVDADKEYDSANVLMELGRSMEKLLTMPSDEFERFRRSTNGNGTPQPDIAPESYHYTTVGDFLMRAQLDAHDSRLPGTGMFDLKTRAVVSIRMNASEFESGVGYQIKSRFGKFESFEREYFDMIRSAFLKYSLQVRIGRMDGIFVAFHNVKRIFGFQYVSLPEMDQCLHSQEDTSLGDAEFKLSVSLWNKVLDRATERFPGKSLRFHFETRDTKTPFMYIFVEPVDEEEINAIQTRKHKEIEAIKKRLLHPDEVANSATHETAYGGVVEGESTGSATIRPPSFQTLEEALQKLQEARSTSSTAEATSGVANILTSETAEKLVDDSDELESEQVLEDNVSHRELLAMTLGIQNRQNGKLVLRPKNFTSEDEWTLRYQLGTIKNRSRALKLYASCLRRRAKLLSDELNGEGSRAFFESYRQTLKDMSEEGRKWREDVDRVEKEEGVITLG